MFDHRASALGAVLAVSALTAGCSSSPDFRPLQADRSTPSELAAAQYDLKVDGQDLGDAKVWSKGPPGDTLHLPTEPERLLEIGIRIRNDSDQPMRLDLKATDLELHTEDERMYVLETPLQVNGVTDIEPGGLQRIVLLYELPAGVELKKIVGYELAWAVDAGGRRVTRSTTFRRAADERGYYYYPYAGGGFGYGYPYYGAWGAYPYAGFGARYGYWW